MAVWLLVLVRAFIAADDGRVFKPKSALAARIMRFMVMLHSHESFETFLKPISMTGLHMLVPNER